MKAGHFRHPMKYTGTHRTSTWAGYVFKERLGYTSGLHTGTDYNRDVPGRDGNADKGDALYAIANGKVVYRGNLTSRGFGNTLVIEHVLSDALKAKLGTDRLYSRYMHMDSMDVAVGQHVGIGQRVGAVGNTGTTWAHLHLDLWKGNLGVHLEYHKDSQLMSYLDPYKTIQTYSTVTKEKTKGETMVGLTELNYIYRLLLGEPPSDHAIKNFIGKRTFSQVIRSVKGTKKFKEHAKRVRDEDRSPLVNRHLPSEMRK